MKKSVRKEVEKIIKVFELNCKVEEFKDHVNWDWTSGSEDFIREFKDYVYWPYISMQQNLSEDFIREFKDYVYWPYISQYQKFSKEFIREFKDKLEEQNND
jgi:hypothetical protein